MANHQLIEAVRRRLALEATSLRLEIDGVLVAPANKSTPADIAIFTGRGRVVIYVRGESVATIEEGHALDSLFREIRGLSGETDLPD